MRFTGNITFMYAFDVGGSLNLKTIKRLPNQYSILKSKWSTPAPSIQMSEIVPDLYLRSPTIILKTPDGQKFYASVKYNVYHTGSIVIMLKVSFKKIGVKKLIELTNLNDIKIIFKNAETTLDNVAKELFEALKKSLQDYIYDRYSIEPIFEKYFIISIDKISPIVSGETLLKNHSKLLTGLLRGEPDWRRLSPQEINSTISSHLTYTTKDIILIDWYGTFIYGSEDVIRDVINILATINNIKLQFRVFDILLSQYLAKISETDKVHLLKATEIGYVHKEIAELIREVERGLWERADYFLGRVYSMAVEKLQVSAIQRRVYNLKEDLKNYFTYVTEILAEKREKQLTLVWILLAITLILELPGLIMAILKAI